MQPEERTLAFDELGVEGEAIARADDGTTVHVPGALPGEQARVVDVHERKRARRIDAHLLSIVEMSPHRTAPDCPHQGHCHGCPLMIAAAPAQRELKSTMVRDRFGIVLDSLVGVPGGELGYRWSSKRVVAGRAGALRLGSYRRGSHHVATMDDCRVDHPDIAAAAREIVEVGSALAIEPYDARRKSGDLRYAWLKTDGRGAVLLTLVTAGEQSRVAELAERLGRPAGVAWAVQPGEGNAMRGDGLRQLRGVSALDVELAGVRVSVGPLGFLQPNPHAAELAYQALVADETGASLAGSLAIDLYAGAGVTTALLRSRFERVHACESYPESAAALGVEPETAEAMLGRLIEERATPELVIANPPRAGLGEAVCERLNELGAGRLHIMSCNPASLGRDRGRLCESGRYHWLGARGFDTLPNTAHVEIVAWLQKS